MAAKKKAPAKKAPAKKRAAKTVAPPPDLHAARIEADTADEWVQQCIRLLNRAKSTQGDFVARDHNVREATEDLQVARANAAELRADFERMKL